MKKISLIIPAFNEEKYIGNCLEYAIKNAGEKIIEIIVVDNNSTDNTKKIAESFIDKYKNLKVVTEIKKGTNNARERGYLESSGEILAFVDSDTKMPPFWINKIISAFEKDSNVSFISGPYEYYDINKVENFFSNFYWYFMAYPTYLILGYIGVGGNFAIRRDVLEKMKGFDINLEFYGDDTNTARRAKKYGKVNFSLNLIMPTSARRFRKQGISNTIYMYFKAFLSEVILHKIFDKNHEDIR